MSHYTLLAQFYADPSVPRLANSALPDAPVQRHVDRRQPSRRLSPARRVRFTRSSRNPARAAA